MELVRSPCSHTHIVSASSSHASGTSAVPTIADPWVTTVSTTFWERLHGASIALDGDVAPPTNVAPQVATRALALPSALIGHGASRTGALGHGMEYEPSSAVTPTARPARTKPRAPGSP